MSRGIDLRLAWVAEASTIAVMSRDLIESGLNWSWTPNRVKQNIRCADTVVLVADVQQQIRGFAIMDFSQEEARLNLLAVAPGYRRSGIGRRLVEWLQKSALVAGISVIYLEVRASNRGAHAFYEKLGYRKIARLSGYYGRESAIQMARDLWCAAPSDTT